MVVVGGSGGVGGGGGEVVSSTGACFYGSGGFGGGGAGYTGTSKSIHGGHGGFGGGGGMSNHSGSRGYPGFGGGTGSPVGGGGGAGMGGAIFNHGGLLTATNSTFAANNAAGGAGAEAGQGLGGAIFNLNGGVALTHCTLAQNIGGGLYNLRYTLERICPDATVSLANSLLAGSLGGNDLTNNCPTNLVLPDGRYNTGAASLTFTGANLIPSRADSGTATSTGPAPLTVDPRLTPLADYGGGTWTRALLPGSPAIGTAAASAVATDQRGLPRVGAPDLGAFESQGFVLSKTGGDNQSTLLGTAFPSPLSVTVTAANPLEPVDGGSVAFSTPATGASATLPSATVTIASGAASVTATANATLGSYTVVVGTAGAPEIGFNLTNLAATVIATASGTSATALPLLSGTAEPGGTVTLYDGATLLGTATADSTGA